MEPTTTTTIEDEVLGTQLTTSTSVVTDVSGADTLPFTGVSGVRLGILGLSLLGGGIAALASTRGWRCRAGVMRTACSLVLSGPGNDASGGVDNATFPFSARL